MDNVIARLTVDGLGDMSHEERKEIATWLKAQAAAIGKKKNEYTYKKFTARFIEGQAA
jgi:chorismate-pyruvate lyase